MTRTSNITEVDVARSDGYPRQVLARCGHKIIAYTKADVERLQRHGCTACQKLARQRAHALRDRRPLRGP